MPIIGTSIPNRVVYSDVNPDVTVDGPYELVFNETAIQKSIETCFATPRYSRPFRRRFGSKLLGLLFEPLDTRTANAIGSELLQVVEEWEPRISDVSILVLPDYENQQYYVEMTYVIPKLDDKLVNYTFNLNKL